MVFQLYVMVLLSHLIVICSSAVPSMDGLRCTLGHCSDVNSLSPEEQDLGGSG